jgi:HD superfamily phosphohydrolase
MSEMNTEIRLETYKTIGDPIHGSIPLTREESDILQLPVLNRLHHVKQMSMAYYVFPGAQISRFAHSIGALYVGSLIVDSLIKSLSKEVFDELFAKWKRVEVIQSVRIACMLHDVGHGPFSHDSEELMSRCLQKIHKSEFQNAMKLFKCKSPDDLPIHEYYSYMLITKSEIAEIVTKAGLSPKAIASLLTKKSSPGSWSDEGFQIVKKIVSSQLDADRMDYLLRDGYATGVPYGDVDIRRLISNLRIVRNQERKYLLVVHERAQSAIEHILNARFMMYKWVYTHHMVVACEELMKKAIERLISTNAFRIKDLYWRNFSQGYTDDSDIWQAFLRAYKRNKSDLISFRGLLDRRFVPNSILKRPLDYKKLVQDVMKESAIKSDKITMEKISHFFTDSQLQNDFRQVLESKKDLEKTVFLAVHKPRSPYEPLSLDDRVIIYDQKSGDMKELTEVSTYFEKINEDWTKFPDVYVAYLLPGIPKSKSSDYLLRIRSALVSFVASAA